jgi:glycosyltransferase involved in cell wall biosynthesis
MINNLQIIQLIYNFQIEGGGGGITRIAIDLSEFLKDYYKITIISLGDFGSSFEYSRIQKLNNQGIKAFAATKWNNKNPYICFIKAYKSISKYLSQISTTTILHSHSEFSDIIALFLKLQYKHIHTIRTCHYGYKQEWKNRPFRRILLTNFLYPLSFNYEVGVNSSITNRLDNRFVSKILHKKAILINEGINLNHFSNTKDITCEIKSILGIPEKANIVGSIGRLAEQKGQKYLLQAAKIVINKIPNTYFIIVGDGPLRNDLEALSRILEIDQHVFFLGSRSDVINLLKCFDIFVLPSLWEGLPISLLESMASNVPVITTSIPGCMDIITNERNGILVDPRNPQALSEAIFQILHSPELRNKLSKNALDTVKEYSIENIAKVYSDLYMSLISS